MRVIATRGYERGALYLLDIYAKNAKEDLTNADRQEIRRRIEAIAAEA